VAHHQKFDDMHKAVIQWLVKAAGFSDGEIAYIMRTERSNIRYIRKSLGLEPNFQPGKRVKKTLAIYQTTHFD